LVTIQPNNNAFGFTMFANLPTLTTHHEQKQALSKTKTINSSVFQFNDSSIIIQFGVLG